MVLEVVTLIISVAFFTVLLLAVTKLFGAEPLGYILGILVFIMIVSVAGIRIAAYE
ncbi:MAG: hypothetical protein WBZ42_08300 [Halobacteriota archaeon]